MKIKKTIQKEETIEIDVETPAFFKSGYQAVLAVYSEDNAITVTLYEGYTDITKCSVTHLYKWDEKLSGDRITEAEFNTALAEAMFKISGIEIVKEAPLSIAV